MALGCYITRTPLDFGALVVWSAADMINGWNVANPAIGSSIASMKDLSGKGQNAVQAVGAQQPILRANIFGSLPGLEFVRASSTSIEIPDGSVVDVTGPLTLYAIFKPDDTTGGGVFYKNVAGSGGNAPYGTNCTSAINAEFTNTTPTTVTPSRSPVVAGTGYMSQCYYDGANVSVICQLGTNSAALTGTLRNTLGTLAIGTRKNTSYFDGYIAEWMLYNRLLTLDERVAVRQYLGNKYSMAVP